MRKKSYDLQVREVKHRFVFNSPISFGNVALELHWSFYALDGETPKLRSTSPLYGYMPEYGNMRSLPNEYYNHIAESPVIERQFKALYHQFVKRAYSPAARKQIEAYVKATLKYYGIPVTSLSHEFVEISMIESNSGERHYAWFSGLPGQDQVYACVGYFAMDDWGHPYLDIKDYHSLVSFAKKMIPMRDKFVRGELSDDERMEFLELYNDDGC